MTEKLRPSVLLALIHLHFTGWMPRHLRTRTFLDALECVERNERVDTQYGPVLPGGLLYGIKDEYRDQVEAHPVAVAVRHFQGLGFTLRSRANLPKTTHWLELKKVHEDGTSSISIAFKSGNWSINYRRERRRAA